MKSSSISTNQYCNNTQPLNINAPKISGTDNKHNIILTPTPIKIVDELEDQTSFISQTARTHSSSILDDFVFLDKLWRPISDLNRSGFFFPVREKLPSSDTIINQVTERKVKFSVDTKPEANDCINNTYKKLGMNMEVVQAICSKRPRPMGDLAVNVGLGIAQDYTADDGELLISKITDSDMKKISRIEDSDIDLFEFGLLRQKNRTKNPSPNITHIQYYEDHPLSRDGILLAKLKFLRSAYGD